jgi:hypothetical protein
VGFELLESVPTNLIKREGNVCTYKVRQRLGDLAIVTDKPPVEVTEPQEGLYSSYGPRSFPILYDSNLLRVNLNTLRRNNKAKVFRIYNVEFALLDIRL